MGVVTIIWHIPAHPPATISRKGERGALGLRKYEVILGLVNKNAEELKALHTLFKYKRESFMKRKMASGLKYEN